MAKPLVLILLGSASDLEMAEHTRNRLDDFGIAHELVISSAHRAPDRTAKLASTAAERGFKVIIAMAGGAAHLPGVVAAHTILPVIGVPLSATTLGGFDALMSVVQMPPGIPVATVAVGKFGVENAAILAAQILALSDPALSKKLVEYKAELARKNEQANQQVKR